MGKYRKNEQVKNVKAVLVEYGEFISELEKWNILNCICYDRQMYSSCEASQYICFTNATKHTFEYRILKYFKISVIILLN